MSVTGLVENVSVRTHDGLPAGSLVGTVGNDSPDVVLETCIQHSIGFIEGEVLDTRRSASFCRQIT
jgi:hypothetical protein